MIVNKKHGVQGSSSVRRIATAIAASAVTLIMVAGCAQSSGGDGNAASDTPVDIRFSTGGAQPPNEMEAAIFSKELHDKGVTPGMGKDYNVKMTFAKGTPEAQGLLIADQVDMTTLAFSTIASTVQKNAVQDGISIVVGHFVDGFSGKFSNTYLVRSDSGINSVADLKGKNIGVNSIGSAVDVILRNAIIKAGLDPEKDMNFVEIGFGAMGQALREKKVDLGSMVQPFSAAEVKQGGVKVLLTAADSVGENSAIAVVARNAFLKKNSAAVKSFLADWVSGLKWLDDPKNHAEAVKLMSGISKTPEESLNLFYGGEQDYHRDDNGCVSAKALQAGVDAMVKVGYLDTTVDMAGLVDSSYLPDPSACK
jgi:ABC-type nitrate/sulfonate/bicarbonate transport systems, periplasmic components